jgi:ABC-type multidrug transport system permease subunit
MAYGMGMGGMGGSTDVDSFSRFWMTAPLILSTLCVFAAWLRLGNGVKIGFGLILVSAAALSSFLHYDGYSVEKIWMIILGSAPLSVLLIAWMFSSKSNRVGESGPGE